MPKSIFPAHAEGLSKFSRRSIFKLAPAAVLAASGSIAAIPSEAAPLSLEQEIDETVAHLEALLAEKYPNAIPDKRLFDEAVRTTREGGYLVMLMAQPPEIAWSGDGYYEVFLSVRDKEPTLMWIEEHWSKRKQDYEYRAYEGEKARRFMPCAYFSKTSLSIYRKL